MKKKGCEVARLRGRAISIARISRPNGVAVVYTLSISKGRKPSKEVEGKEKRRQKVQEVEDVKKENRYVPHIKISSVHSLTLHSVVGSLERCAANCAVYSHHQDHQEILKKPTQSTWLPN